jgi:hypothetical protein
MNTFKNMRLEAWRTENKRGKVIESMVSLHADDGRICSECGEEWPCKTREAALKLDDWTTHQKWDNPPRKEGLGYLSFFFTGQEFSEVCEQRRNSVNDIGHNLRACGEGWTFYDLDFTCEDRGVMQVPFVRLTVPYYVQKVLLRVVKSAWEKCIPDEKRITIDLSLARRERWLKVYGQGHGSVKLDFGGYKSEEVQAYFDKCKIEGGDSFARCAETVEAIARNTTFAADEVAKVHVRSDSDGFYWEAHTPKGQRTMNGGIINHGRDGSHDWSVHT